MGGAFVGNALAAVIGILNIISGTYNALLWVNVVLWLLFALGFAYFLYIKPDAA